MQRLVVLIVILIIILGLASVVQKYFPVLQQFSPSAITVQPGPEKIKVVTEENITIDIVKRSGSSVVTVSGQSTAPQSNNVSPFDFGPFGGIFGFGPQAPRPGGQSQPDQSQPNQPESIGSGFI